MWLKVKLINSLCVSMRTCLCHFFSHVYVCYWQALYSILHTHMNMDGLILIMTVQTCHWLIKQSDGCVDAADVYHAKPGQCRCKSIQLLIFFSLFHIDLKFLHPFLCLSVILANADIDKQISLTSWLWHFCFFSFLASSFLVLQMIFSWKGLNSTITDMFCQLL